MHDSSRVSATQPDTWYVIAWSRVSRPARPIHSDAAAFVTESALLFAALIVTAASCATVTRAPPASGQVGRHAAVRDDSKRSAADAANTSPSPQATTTPTATFSIVAYDAATEDLGVAVQSKFFAVGAVVPWAEAGVGAVATQAFANTTFGPRALAALRRGEAPQKALEALLASDPQSAQRQVAIVGANGRVAAHTGAECYSWAGHERGDAFAVQGNLLVSEATVKAMASAYRQSRGELAERLVTALAAGQAAGGDVRGQQSAACVVVRLRGGYAGLNDRYVDVRVDDHPRPVQELRRLVQLSLRRDPISRARIRFAAGDRAAARQLLREALERHPTWDALLFSQATLAAEDRDRATVERVIEEYVRRSPGDAQRLFDAARIWLRLGEVAQALTALDRCLRLQPHYRTVLRRQLNSGDPIWQQAATAVEGLLEDSQKR